MNFRTQNIAMAVILCFSSAIARQKPRPLQTQEQKTAPAMVLEIKGQRIGDTVSQFTANFPNSKCQNKAAQIRECIQHQGVSLAGLNTDLVGCNPATTPPPGAGAVYWKKICDIVGVRATFENDKLTQLNYRFWINAVKNDSEERTKKTCAAFSQKFGQPDMRAGKDGCGWSATNKNGEIKQQLVIRTVWVTLADGAGFAALTEIILSNELPSKDI